MEMPKKFKKKGIIYKLIKLYDNFGLYQNVSNGTRECFTEFQLGVLQEKVKPDKEANKGGAIKYKGVIV